MNRLADLLAGVNPLEVLGPKDAEISDLSMNSRKVGPGSLYVAVRGLTTDGHRFIDATLQAGARAIVCERVPAHLQDGVTYIRVENSSIALGQLASAIYGRPSSRMRVIGITGTNGKTTTATLLARLFRSLGYGGLAFDHSEPD